MGLAPVGIVVGASILQKKTLSFKQLFHVEMAVLKLTPRDVGFDLPATGTLLLALLAVVVFNPGPRRYATVPDG
jgi:hypothetical protein